MSRTKSDCEASRRHRDNNAIPSWQSNRMRSLIAERWQEVWQIVEAREKEKKLDSSRL